MSWSVAIFCNYLQKERVVNSLAEANIGWLGDELDARLAEPARLELAINANLED